MYEPHIRQQQGKDYIFCDWRRKYVRLTPEEWVRQQFLHQLTEQGYPPEMLAVETPIEVAGCKKRCDAVVYSRELQPLCIIEFKAPTVALTQHVIDQVAVYNRRLNVEHFIISNGRDHRACRITPDAFQLLPYLPAYSELCQRK